MDATIVPKMQKHYPVLLKEIISVISPQHGGTFIDCTFGQGGYTKKILDFHNTNVIAIDRDIESEKIANQLKEKFEDRFITETIVNVNSTTLKSGVRTKDSSKYEVGNKFTDDTGTEFTVTAITKPSSPLSSDLEIDLLNTEVIQRNVTNVDLDKMAATGNAAAQHTISFEIRIG